MLISIETEDFFFLGGGGGIMKKVYTKLFYFYFYFIYSVISDIGIHSCVVLTEVYIRLQKKKY